MSDNAVAQETDSSEENVLWETESEESFVEYFE